MKEIALSRGEIALVDDQDAHLARYRWRLKAYRNNRQYVVRSDDVRLARMIMKAKPGQHVVHLDGDPLNHQRSNLRLATFAQAQAGSRGWRTNRSGYRGVSPTKSGKWFARIHVVGKCRHLGTYPSAIEAAQAYARAARSYWGEEYARLPDLGDGYQLAS